MCIAVPGPKQKGSVTAGAPTPWAWWWGGDAGETVGANGGGGEASQTGSHVEQCLVEPSVGSSQRDPSTTERQVAAVPHGREDVSWHWCLVRWGGKGVD